MGTPAPVVVMLGANSGASKACKIVTSPSKCAAISRAYFRAFRLSAEKSVGINIRCIRDGNLVVLLQGYGTSLAKMLTFVGVEGGSCQVRGKSVYGVVFLGFENLLNYGF